MRLERYRLLASYQSYFHAFFYLLWHLHANITFYIENDATSSKRNDVINRISLEGKQLIRRACKVYFFPSFFFFFFACETNRVIKV